MEQEIKDIIAKNLPQHVGDVLKERLNKADKLEAEVDYLNRVLSEANKDINNFKEKLEKERQHIYSEQQLKAEWSKLEERERNLEVEMLKLKLEESQKRADVSTKLVETIFRSPVYRKHVENMTLGSYDVQGRYNQTNAVPVNITEITD
jgi:predicted RNase H-like nuclease (RuvC/YqgF family)